MVLKQKLKNFKKYSLMILKNQKVMLSTYRQIQKKIVIKSKINRYLYEKLLYFSYKNVILRFFSKYI